MLRGSSTAKIDDRGRIKIPADFRRSIEERYGNHVFVTSTDGQFVRVYPQKIWHEIEKKLATLPTMNPARTKFLNVVNYWGQLGTMDKQGRILIPPQLREAAALDGTARVLGQQKYLDVWNEDRFATKIGAEPLTDEDYEVLSSLGI